MAKTDFREFMAEDRRLAILQVLTEALEYNLNEDVLQRALQHVGHNVGGDIVRADVTWLSEHRLVKIDKVDAPSGRELWIVTLCRSGEEVGRGRPYPGVRRPMAI